MLMVLLPYEGGKYNDRRSQWPHGLRRRSAAARLLRLYFRIPPGAWVFVCCECYMLSGRGLCDELITSPEESYRLWCVIVCDLETSWMGRPWPTWGTVAPKENRYKSTRHSVMQLALQFVRINFVLYVWLWGEPSQLCLSKSIKCVHNYISKKWYRCINYMFRPLHWPSSCLYSTRVSNHTKFAVYNGGRDLVYNSSVV
jgi:hypothetical protein